MGNDMMKIIMDADPGIDDFIAISLALQSHNFDVLGLTIVEGNCSIENACKNAFKALDMCGRYDIEVYKGLKQKGFELHAAYAHGNNGLGDIEYESIDRKVNKESAISYLIRMVNTYPHQITILVFGPLTNIAECVKRDKEFAKKVKSLLIMGGSNKLGNITPYAEFNFYKDPVSASIVLQAQFKEILVFGWDVTCKIPLLDKQEQQLNNSTKALPKFIYNITRVTSIHDTPEYGGPVISDPLLVAYLIDNSVVKFKNAQIKIVTSGEEKGCSKVKFVDKSNIQIATEADAQKFHQILLNTIV